MTHITDIHHFSSTRCLTECLPLRAPHNSCPSLGVVQGLLMAFRANDADGYKSWLALGIEELGRDIAGEVESDWMVPLLVI